MLRLNNLFIYHQYMADNLVGFSRAGDEFHYRWAARRCLGMVYPNSHLKFIVIESSVDDQLAGEYAIDVAEYYGKDDNIEEIKYFQLKHTSVQQDTPFELSDLKKTFEDFALRFIDHDNKNEIGSKNVSFTIITNRKFSDNFKTKLSNVSQKLVVNQRFKNTLEDYTKLNGNKLSEFCSLITIEDSHGDYLVQKEDLRVEISRLRAGSTNNTQIELLIALVRDKVLPDSNRKIVKEEVLGKFGISSERGLYPAEPFWELPAKIIRREQHTRLINDINSSTHSVIVHAAGGVGKSVFTREFVESLPEGSVGIAYDSFGAGKYRNRSEARHKHRDALVQIANELAAMGLCGPLLVDNLDSEKDITFTFLSRIDTAVKTIKAAYEHATLTILIDAADNAEMAAKQFNESCFAHELLRELMPLGSKLVFLCRTERIDLLKPQSNIVQLQLEQFSESETLANLINYYQNASADEAKEFHRLTSGNPRVQANALDIKADSLAELLEKLGPMPVSVEDQIQSLLDKAVDRIKDQLPESFHEHVNAICLGLANLSPNIPIDILAKAAGVQAEMVKSFVADIGRSLWLSNTSVQFRDEPTETWFRNKFSGSKELLEQYISILEPLAEESGYTSEMLPQLYLQSEQYDKLINIALSDDYLPKNNPIDARNVRIYRLQFAFKASLKTNNIKNAVKLAIRAGEEVAGHTRQFELLKDNIGLLVLLQSPDKIQNLALRRRLRGSWDGSENLYSASLLSSIDDFKGEARGFLRASKNWLGIYFDEMRKETDHYRQEKLSNGDLLELSAAYLNLDGPQKCIEFLNSIKPKELIYTILKDLVRRLIDERSYSIVDELLIHSQNEPYFVIAIACELKRVGRFPPKNLMETALKLLAVKKTRIPIPDNINDKTVLSDLLTFLESCIYERLTKQKIKKVVEHYFNLQPSRMVYDSHFSDSRDTYLRSLAIRIYSGSTSKIILEELLPSDLKEKKNKHDNQQHIKELEQIIKGVLPWYQSKIEALSSGGLLDLDKIENVNNESIKALASRYRTDDPLLADIARVCVSILMCSNQTDPEQVKKFYELYIKENKKININSWLAATRAAYRSQHLSAIAKELEVYCFNLILSSNDNSPEDISNWYIRLAKAVLAVSKDDAVAYFDEAINIVSKFGDEIIQRWESVVALAKQSVSSTIDLEELSYRFIKTAEVVGENAREKHWDRAEAIQICARMHTGGGIASLSRWRDREVGRFDWLHHALLIELTNSEKISGLKAWSLAPFCPTDQLRYFLKDLLKSSKVTANDKNIILSDAIDRLERENINPDYWEKLSEVTNQNGITNDRLLSLVITSKTGQRTESPHESSVEPDYDLPWVDILQDVDLLTDEGLRRAQKRLQTFQGEKNLHLPRWVFWKAILKEIEERDLFKFIEVVLSADFIEEYDVMEIFNRFPSEWLTKISFKNQYGNILRQIGGRYARELTNSYAFDHLFKGLPPEDQKTRYLSEGIFQGLAEGNEFANAEIFFGFIKLASSFLTPDDSVELLDYSISRFEVHIDKSFGDGPWDAWLKTSENIDENLAGYLWSALGSPRRGMRWNAAHTVVRLAKFNSLEVLDSLYNWLAAGNVGVFGHNNFPFYNLHARQYLLIAIARISIENPTLLHSHSDVFSKYALDDHAIIQNFAKRIALAIEASCPGTYDSVILEKIRNVGISSFPTQKQRYNYKTDTYWHKKGEVKTDLDFHFSWDFDHYWFDPLGRVFGVTGKQIEDLAADIVVNQWGIASGGGYNADSRVILWNRDYRDESTHHSHGSYPRTDNLDFYHSYHSMMIVASKLLDKMPLILTDDWTDDSWDYWLSGHVITRDDGIWLSDLKDSLPRQRPDWIVEAENKDWKLKIPSNSFLDGIVVHEDGRTWINVRGYWDERSNSKTENFIVASALVSSASSQSLMNALSTTENPHDFKLPYYDEEDMEVDSPPFKLKGWLTERNVTKGIDAHDLFVAELTYPPYQIGKNVIDALNLVNSKDNKIYYSPISPDPSIITKLWSSPRESRDEEPAQDGMTMKCTLDFVKHLCKTLNCELIIEIQIQRNISHRYDNDRGTYKPPKHKIFIISSDGKIRDTTRSYQLR